jgi:SAM-dependent methyltransferase
VTSSENWRAIRARLDLDEYDARWEQMAARGQHVHGEADFVTGYAPSTVLDAGCGTGRVGSELARRGITVVGVDNDHEMLERARRRAPQVTWIEADLAAVELGRRFDVVVMAGNVVPFVDPPARPAAVAGCARHVGAGGRLVSGASLQAGWPSLDDYDGWCTDAGLELEARFATWERQPWAPGGSYAVSVHRAS